MKIMIQKQNKKLMKKFKKKPFVVRTCILTMTLN